MRVKYLGPRDSIGVAGYGLHLKDEVKDYPDEVGVELVTTSVRQKFEAPDGIPEGAGEQGGKGESEMEELTKAELIAMCEERGIEVPKKPRKAELIELIAHS